MLTGPDKVTSQGEKHKLATVVSDELDMLTSVAARLDTAGIPYWVGRTLS